MELSLASAFASAWTETKKLATLTAALVKKDAPAIETATRDAGGVVTAVDPAAAPIVTDLDNLEPLVMGKIFAAATDVSQAASLSALFGEAWPAIEAFGKSLTSHPTVASATAALKS
jgi:hypothetical protein